MADDSMYYVITADIIGSRKIDRVADLAERGLTPLNAKYGNAMVASFALYRGDEIQGVLDESVDIVRFVRHFRFLLRPLNLRLGVGWGNITTGLSREYAWQMDGNAFHLSRQALDSLKSSRAPATCFAGQTGNVWELVNVFYSLLDALQNQWSDKQWQAVHAAETEGTLKRAAQLLGISPQNVSKRCRAASWKTVSEAERYIQSVIRGGLLRG